MSNAQHTFTTEAAVPQSDAAEYVVRILDCGAIVYEEVDVIVLDL